MIAGGFQVPALQYEGYATRLLQPLTPQSESGEGEGETNAQESPLLSSKALRQPGQKEEKRDGGEGDEGEGFTGIVEYPAVVGEGGPSPFDVLVVQDGNSFSNKEAEGQAVQRLIQAVDQVRPRRQGVRGV